ncbi:MAG: hypothetical protein AAF420_10695 [Pseudomonadota bacterium]
MNIIPSVSFKMVSLKIPQLAMLKTIGILIAVAWVALYIGIAKKLEAKVIHRVDEDQPEAPLKQTLKLDLFVFLFVFLRQYRDHFSRELAVLSDLALTMFLCTMGLLIYFMMASPVA